MCYIYGVEMMMEQSKVSDSNTKFETFIYFDDSHGFEGCYSNELSFNYYIGKEKFQGNNINNINNETSTLFRIESLNFNQANQARLSIINFIISQRSNFVTVIENDIVSIIITIQHLTYFFKIMKTFHMYFNVDSIQNSMFNNPFDKLSIMLTIFANDNINTNGTLNSIGIKLFNNIFNNANNDNLVILLFMKGEKLDIYTIIIVISTICIAQVKSDGSKSKTDITCWSFTSNFISNIIKSNDDLSCSSKSIAVCDSPYHDGEKFIKHSLTSISIHTCSNWHNILFLQFIVIQDVSGDSRSYIIVNSFELLTCEWKIYVLNDEGLSTIYTQHDGIIANNMYQLSIYLGSVYGSDFSTLSQSNNLKISLIKRDG